MQHIIKDADGLSSTDIANAQNLVAKYAQEVQEFLAEVQEQSLEAQSMTASASGALQSYATLAASYNEKFTTYMMVSFPKPQQGGQNAR